MENYKVLNRLGKGSQGQVFLVEDRHDNLNYVLKKVECNDESEANKAFKEAMALQELEHPYICGYKEFFVTWDKEVSAMFVCIVMDYYKNGDLDRVLKQRRSKQTVLEEVIIKKWIGQMIESLEFIHSKKVIHRDLKPSNIFLKDDLSLSIGDFGVATVMGDSRTRTRTTIGSMNWVAPEVLERQYDERSDIWSLGCMIVEMITCGFLDVNGIMDKLYHLKNDATILEDLLKEGGKSFSSELISIVRSMLRRDYKQRPTAAELCSLPYIRECLALSGIESAQKQKKVQFSSSGPLPEGASPADIIKYLDGEPSEENICQALNSLNDQLSDDSSLPLKGDELIVLNSMKEYVGNKELLIAGCSVLNKVLNADSEAGVDDSLCTNDIMSFLPQAMKAHGGSQSVQESIAALLLLFTSNVKASDILGKTDVIACLLDGMKMFRDNSALVESCCKTLFALSLQEDNLKSLLNQKCGDEMISCLLQHIDNPDVVASILVCIDTLLMDEGETAEQVLRLDFVNCCMEALQMHDKEAQVASNTYLVLSDLVYHSEEAAFQLLEVTTSKGTQFQGIPMLVSTYNHHKDNVDVASSYTLLFKELVAYDEMLPMLKMSLEVINSLKLTKKSFNKNEDIVNNCEEAINSINNAK